jgi:hypothetical protein
LAVAASISSTAAAASLMPLALPAVTVPFSLTNTGFIFWNLQLGAGAEVLVLVEGHLALAALEHDGQDLSGKAALGPGAFGALVAPAPARPAARA